MGKLSEEEIIKNLEEFLKGPCEICKYCDGAIRNHRKAIQGLLDLYTTEKIGNENLQILLDEEKDKCVELATTIDALNTDLAEEKEKNKVYTELLKQNENRAKIKTCMTHNLPDNAEIICMIREDFERNFGNDYISKDKLSKLLEKRIKQYRKMGFNEAYSALVDLDEELLEERKQ